MKTKYKLIKTSDDIEINMLQNRNLTKEEANSLLNPTKKMVEDTSHYKNLNNGIDMYLKTIEEGGLIATLVDVDADGYLSSSIAYQFTVDELGYENMVYIIKDNKAHGLTDELIDKLSKSDVKLLIIPDAGSENYKLLKQVSELDINVLILDHHIIEFTQEEQQSLHNVVIVNNQDGQVENIYLSGTGVTYKFFKEVAKIKKIKLGNKYIDLVALSLITDVCDMKMSYENRYFLSEGSKISKITNDFIGFVATKLKKKKRDKFTITDFGFQLGPKINSIIRYGTIEEKEMLFNALIGCTDTIEGLTYQEMTYKTGDRYQRNQRNAVNEIVPQLQDIIEKNHLDTNPVIFIDVTDVVNSNIRGLVCNKLIDKYKRPVMVSSLDNGYYAGSSRGYETEQLSDFKEFCEQTNLFEYLKGHANAHGHKIKKENVPLFLDYCKNTLDIQHNSQIEIEGIYNREIPLEDLLCISEYEELWCNQISIPKYLLTDVCITEKDIERTGNSTYVIKLGEIAYIKEFGSLVRYQNILDAIEENGGKLSVDILVEFRKGRKSYAKIIDIEW